MSEGEHSFNNTGRMRRATFAEVCTWIVAAWNGVKTSSIINGFRKAKIGTADDDAPIDSPDEEDDDDGDTMIDFFS